MQERQQHHAFWAGRFRSLPLEDLFRAESQVEATLASPGWKFLNRYIETERAALVARLTARAVVPHGEYIGITRTLRAFEVLQQQGRVLLDVAAEVRREEERKANAAAGGEGA